MSSRGKNLVILFGNIGNDPESRSFPDGGTVTNISVATSEHWTDKQGQKQERTEWHRVSLRDRGNYKLGQIGAQYLKKGSKVYIEGKLQTRQYKAQDGHDRYVIEIIANELQMLDSRTEPAGGAGKSQPSANPAGGHGAGVPPSFDDFDDDIPF